jgi:hypothetical protein
MFKTSLFYEIFFKRGCRQVAFVEVIILVESHESSIRINDFAEIAARTLCDVPIASTDEKVQIDHLLLERDISCVMDEFWFTF